MLQQLTLENFKGLKNAQLDFGRITVLIGPNGTGKSSISQALMLLRQSTGSRELKTDGPLVNLGTFEDILTKEASKAEIGIGLSVGVAAHELLSITSGASYSYSAYFDPRVISFDAAVVSGGKKCLVAKRGENVDIVNPKGLMDDRFDEGEIRLEFATGELIAQPVLVHGVVHRGKLANNQVRAFRKETDELLPAIARLLGNTYYVPAIRGLEQPEYGLGTESKRDFEPGKNAEVASAFAYAGRDIEELVSMWSKSITGSDIGASLIPGRKVTIRSYAVPGGIPVIGDGFGTNQLVQLLLTLAIIPNQSVLAIEEPEIHLHPKAQEKLCDILVDIGKAHDKQIIVTTHSQHVLYGFVAAVRNETLTRDELAIYYFEEKGKSPYRVEQDEYGDIYDWGRNFFNY